MRVCAFCSGPIPSGMRPSAGYCSRLCKNRRAHAARVARARGADVPRDMSRMERGVRAELAAVLALRSAGWLARRLEDVMRKAPFDVVGFSPCGRLLRLEVKVRGEPGRLRRWRPSGCTSVRRQFGRFDVLALVDPDSDEVRFYPPLSAWLAGRRFSLRMVGIGTAPLRSQLKLRLVSSSSS